MSGEASADRTSAHFKQHPSMDVSEYPCDDIHYIKSILLASRKVADNVALELNQLKPPTAKSCNEKRVAFDTVAKFRRDLITRCRDAQLARLAEPASNERSAIANRLRFYNAEIDVESVLDATVERRFQQTCRQVLPTQQPKSK
jgi:hypothetical protein